MSHPRKYAKKQPCGHPDANYAIIRTESGDQCRACRPTTFPCGHPRTSDNSTKERKPLCRICRNARQRDRYSTFKCGHAVTDENTRWSGKGKRLRRCLTCDTQKQVEAAERARRREYIAADRHAKAEAVTATIALYRAEKAAAKERQQNRVMLEAKREYEAMLKREADLRKGGRPRKSGAYHLQVSSRYRPAMPQCHSDPRDALLNALGDYSGAA